MFKLLRYRWSLFVALFFLAFGVIVLGNLVTSADYGDEVNCESLEDGDFIKVHGTNDIWRVNDDMTRSYFPNGASFKSWNYDDGYSGNYLYVTNDCMGSFETSGSNGAVIPRSGSYILKKQGSDKLYVVEYGKKITEIDKDIAKELYGDNFPVLEVTMVDWMLYKKFVTNNKIEDPIPHPGMLVKKNDRTYYVDEGNKLRQVTGSGMRNNRFKENFVRNISMAYLARFEYGDSLLYKEDKFLRPTRIVDEDVDEVVNADCRDLTGNDGAYYICKGKYFKHLSTGVKFTLVISNNDYVDFSINKPGRDEYEARLYKAEGAYGSFLTSDSTRIKYLYQSSDSQGVEIKVESYPLSSQSCDLKCADWSGGTDGHCTKKGNYNGELMGGAYCVGTENYCYCDFPTCTSDNDCTNVDSHSRCINGGCQKPSCDYACREIYNYKSGHCGAAEGTGKDVGCAYCGVDCIDQCRCFDTTLPALCIDSDGGKDYEEKGIVDGFSNDNIHRGAVEDYCSNDSDGSSEIYIGTYLFEYSCDSDGGYTKTKYTCPNGCQEGACKAVIRTSVCDDYDGQEYDTDPSSWANWFTYLGDASFVSSRVKYDGQYYYDTCRNGKMIENVCIENELKQVEVTCPDGCSGGKCNKLSCSSTDNGTDTIKGSSTGYLSRDYTERATKTDTCVRSLNDTTAVYSSDYILDWYCSDTYSSVLAHYVRKCTHGCVNGACIKIEASCSEGDNGREYNKKATTSGKDNSGNSFSSTDYCSGSTQLVEYSCDYLSNGAPRKLYNTCANGCENGACKAVEPSCTDYDDGKDYDKRSYVVGKWVISDPDNSYLYKTDVCKDENVVTEYSCNSAGDDIVETEYTCEFGCYLGKCQVDTSPPDTCVYPPETVSWDSPKNTLMAYEVKMRELDAEAVLSRIYFSEALIEESDFESEEQLRNWYRSILIMAAPEMPGLTCLDYGEETIVDSTHRRLYYTPYYEEYTWSGPSENDMYFIKIGDEWHLDAGEGLL